MSTRLTANQNKIRLIAVFLFTVMTVVALRVYQGLHSAGADAAVNGANPVNDSLFVGLRHASAPEVRQALPEATGKPAVLYFGSRLCHDCQRMSPVVSLLMSQHPQVYFKKLDVMEDQDKAPAIFRTFKPISVPVVVFINAQGEIRNVLYDYQKPDVLASTLNALTQPATHKKEAGKSVPPVAPPKK
jgi:thiol:disulfide interchange protein